MNILLVEDHEDTRSSLERILSYWGHSVTLALDLAEGLRWLQNGRFDAIISDIALPDGTGYALMSNARRWGVETLAIAISAYPYPGEVEEPDVTGFDYYLSKPFTSEDLRALLQEGRRADKLHTAPTR